MTKIHKQARAAASNSVAPEGEAQLSALENDPAPFLKMLSDDIKYIEFESPRPAFKIEFIQFVGGRSKREIKTDDAVTVYPVKLRTTFLTDRLSISGLFGDKFFFVKSNNCDDLRFSRFEDTKYTLYHPVVDRSDHQESMHAYIRRALVETLAGEHPDYAEKIAEDINRTYQNYLAKLESVRKQIEALRSHDDKAIIEAIKNRTGVCAPN